MKHITHSNIYVLNTGNHSNDLKYLLGGLFYFIFSSECSAMCTLRQSRLPCKFPCDSAERQTSSLQLILCSALLLRQHCRKERIYGSSSQILVQVRIIRNLVREVDSETLPQNTDSVQDGARNIHFNTYTLDDSNTGIHRQCFVML